MERWTLVAILMLALGLRLHGVGFGLPALNDPDEPLFMMTALDMLRGHSLNPHWFGHPGTITLYSIALVSLAVAGIGIATGRFASADAFVGAVYADPGILFLPARLLIVLCGVACVYLTWSIGRRIGGARIGLIAAAILAVDALHVGYSQIIRTDVQASVFMLLCTRAAIAIRLEGHRRAWLMAGLWAGLACATKWPAVLVIVNPLVAGLSRGRWSRRHLARVALIPVAALVALFIASPFLLLDYPTVLRDLAGEARPIHPGATGAGPLANLGWYLAGPIARSLGLAGLALAGIGLALALWRERTMRLAVLPGFGLFLLVVIAQALRWERWVVPLLPFLALLIGYALCALMGGLRALRPRWRLPHAEAALTLLLMLPMLQTTLARASERTNDTRQRASAWVRAHVPPGSTILVEHGAFDLLGGPWRFLFPLGAAGCVEPRQILSGRISYARVETLRVERPVIDLGHVDDTRLASCAADYAILTHRDRYRADRARFAPELARYQAVLGHARLLATLRPEPGASAGPVVEVFALREVR